MSKAERYRMVIESLELTKANLLDVREDEEIMELFNYLIHKLESVEE